MAEAKVWCWEAAQNRHGPDWLLIAQFTATTYQELARVAQQTVLTGYTPWTREFTYCHHHQAQCEYYTCVDESQREAWLGDRNMWVYNMVRVHADTIEIESGYGGRGEALNLIETTFLLDLCATPTLTLGPWKVLAGGNFYEYHSLHEGVGLADLRSYLSH